jgi:hypothetical protein
MVGASVATAVAAGESVARTEAGSVVKGAPRKSLGFSPGKSRMGVALEDTGTAEPAGRAATGVGEGMALLTRVWFEVQHGIFRVEDKR